MNFVTVKEFHDAMAIIQKAIGQRQVVCGTDKLPMVGLLFTSDNVHYDLFKPEQLAFVEPLQAAKNNLIELRKELKKNKEEVTKTKKTVEELELEEQKLLKLLPILKE